MNTGSQSKSVRYDLPALGDDVGERFGLGPQRIEFLVGDHEELLDVGR